MSARQIVLLMLFAAATPLCAQANSSSVDFVTDSAVVKANAIAGRVVSHMAALERLLAQPDQNWEDPKFVERISPAIQRIVSEIGKEMLEYRNIRLGVSSALLIPRELGDLVVEGKGLHKESFWGWGITTLALIAFQVGTSITDPSTPGFQFMVLSEASTGLASIYNYAKSRMSWDQNGQALEPWGLLKRLVRMTRVRAANRKMNSALTNALKDFATDPFRVGRLDYGVVESRRSAQVEILLHRMLGNVTCQLMFTQEGRELNDALQRLAASPASLNP